MENDLANLRIDNKEDEAWELHGEEGLGKSLYEYCLVGYFLIASVVHFQAVRNAMENLSHPLRGVLISDLGEKHYLFKFYHKVDIDRVVNEPPWTFNNHLLLFHRLKGEEDPLQISLLEDLEYIESCFTWKKGNFKENNIWEWLDHGVVNSTWSGGYWKNLAKGKFNDYAKTTKEGHPFD
ncbi:hypothetical protein Gorai_017033 [Gossypium raimondii]|uniref:DUF4283 domain-containing protein n=1 Tax=Gossypium raimondii TaxID=29730 RepID=A0A7J8PAK3_GOSRA|nr:hypothetical protein [Gossypium raimondii]